MPGIHRLIRELAAYEESADQVAATEDDLRAALFGPFAHSQSAAVFAHVAQAGGEVAGFALWFVNYSTWTGQHGVYLEDLYVTPALRGTGTGRALLAALARLCTERGYARLDWAVLDWNTSALDFYVAMGARRLSDWVPHRLEGQALADLAALAPPTASQEG